jgi:anaerobic selenocysteine-containing dehydrogenase
MINRRDLFKFAGGATVGAMLTPAPWRLITDTALWSENWPGVPRPARGEVSTRFTHCPLCPAGCAIRARCVAGQPFSLAGADGGLCPFGVTAHHLPYHPKRLFPSRDRQGAVLQATDEAAAAVSSAIAKCSSAERVAVLDLRPGRTASATYRRAMGTLKNGAYIAPAEPAVAVNLANARTILSLGAPLLDGWCAPSRAFAVRDQFRLIQAEPFESRTAALADVWLPIGPGSEEALALALAGRIPLREGAERTGLKVRQIGQLADELQNKGPALVIDPAMSPNVVALNIAIGAWGRTVVPRAMAPATPLAAIPDRSIRVLMIDESLPGEHVAWSEIEKKLVADDPLVVAFAFTPDGYAQHARFALPVPVFPEAAGDLAQSIDSPVPTFRLVSPLIGAPAGTVNPPEFVAKLAGFNASDALRERADEIHAAGKGRMAGLSTPLQQLSADEFWKALNSGDHWVGDEPKATAPKAEFQAAAPLVATSLTAVAAERALTDSPLLSKLYRESNLLLGPGRIAMHPDDAQARGLDAGARARLDVGAESRSVEVTLDPNLRPGIVLTAGIAGSAKVVRI